MTTNFDQLVLQGIILAGVIPVVADGLSALSRVASRPDYRQFIHLHGSMHTYELRNSVSAVNATQEALSMQGTIFGLKDAGLLVVVGYSGSEDGGVITLLEKSFAAFPNLQVFWVLYEESTDALNTRVRTMLTGRNKFVILNQDADRFFAQLLRELGFGAPEWMENPLSILDAINEKIVDPKEPIISDATKDFRAKLDRYRKAPSASADDIILERARFDSPRRQRQYRYRGGLAGDGCG
ncbi:hypothetical protein ACWGTI_30560 [Mesorhizobium sp. ArgA1]